MPNLLPPINLVWKGWDQTSFSGGGRTKTKVNGGEVHALAPAGSLPMRKGRVLLL